MVTAEVAVAIPSLLLVLGIALAAIDLGIAQVRCVDAARTGARLLARAEGEAVTSHQVRAAAPRGAVVTVSTSGDLVTVRVTSTVPAALAVLGLRDGPSATATAVLEVGS